MPAGLAWLAGSLGPAHEVRILDGAVLAPEELEAGVRAFGPEVVGLSLRNVDTTNYGDPHVFFAAFPPLARRLRALVGPGVPLVVGGPGFTLFARAVLARVPELDFGIPGEGEVAFSALLEHFGDPGAASGVLYRRDGVVQASPPAPPAALAALRPCYDLLDLDRYLPFQDRWAVGVQTRRGCTQRCAYCAYPLLHAGPVRLRSPEAVVDEIEGWHSRGFARFMFADSLFDRPRAHAVAVLEALAARRLPVTWRAYHGVRDLDPAWLALCVRAGCRELTFSPDAYGDASLDLLGKDCRRADIDRSLEALVPFPEIKVAWNFFVGLPGQGPRELAGMLRFQRRARRRLGARVGELRASYVRVEPGTALHRRLLAAGAFSPDDPLLPETPAQLRALFSRQSGHALLDALLAMPLVERRVFSHRRRE